MTSFETLMVRLLHSLAFGFAGTLAVSIVLLTISMKISERREQERASAKSRNARKEQQLEADRHATWIRNKRMNMR